MPTGSGSWVGSELGGPIASITIPLGDSVPVPYKMIFKTSKLFEEDGVREG